MTLENQIEWKEPQTPEQIMSEAFEEHGIEKIYVLFSGGKDSSSALHFVATNYPKQFAGAVFTNVGLGAQETRKFVIDYCHRMNWKLHLTWPSENERFFPILMKYGFAFPGNHSMWMGYLKQHTWYYFMKDKLASGEKAAFVSGVRKKESKRRFTRQSYKKPIDIGATQTYIKPFFYKNGLQLSRYFFTNNLEKTSVYDWLNRSGECYCGSFTEPWDLKLLETHDPLAFNTIRYYEKKLEEKLDEIRYKLDKIGRKRRISDHQIDNWFRLYTSKNKQLRESLTAEQKQLVALKHFNKWGKSNITTDEVIEQQTLDELFGGDITINDDYCGESCVVE